MTHKVFNTKNNVYLILCVLITMIVDKTLYGFLSIDFVFLFVNFIVFVIVLLSITFFFKKWSGLSSKGFEQRLFYTSLLIRIFVMTALYVLFIYITKTPFSVEAIDSLEFHHQGIIVAQELNRGVFNPRSFMHYQDMGNPIFYGIIYYFFGVNIYFTRFIQAVISAYTVLLFYKSLRSITSENVSRLSSIILMVFPSVLFYVGTHAKETMLLFLLVLSISSMVNMVTRKFKYLDVFTFVVATTFLLTFRPILSFVVTITFIFFLIVYKANSYRSIVVNIKGKNYKLIISVVVIITFIFLSKEFGLLDYYFKSLFSYLGIGNYEKVGGRSISEFLLTGKNYIFLLSGLVLLPASLITPFPSMVKTNIQFFNQTEQWYHIGGLFFWVFFSFFIVIGFIFIARKRRWNELFPYIMVGLSYTVILIASFYITSIRFNLEKMVFLIPVIALGIENSSIKQIKKWRWSILLFCIIIIGWNYVKLSSRGLL